MHRLVIGAILLFRLDSNAAASCAPAALVRGPEDIVATITRMLAERGISTQGAEGCPFLRVVIEAKGSTLSVTIEDAYGRKHEHRLSDIEVVATLIESWADTREEAPLLAARGWSRPAEPPAVDIDTPAVLIVYRDPVLKVGASLALETSLGTDGSAWWGVAAATCVRLGPSCAGAVVRIASDARLSGPSENLETGRTSLDVLLAVDFQFTWGALQVTPGAGVGVGWIRSSVTAASDVVDVDTGGLRTDAHVVLAWPITHMVAVELRGALDLSPLAHVGTYMEQGTMLAGEPRGFSRVSVGLRYGAR